MLLKFNKKAQMKNNEGVTHSKKEQLVKKTILGVAVTDASADEVLEYVNAGMRKTREAFLIVTPNPEMIVRAQKDPKFKSVLNTAEISLCDGAGLLVASKFLQRGIRERITGISFMKKVCEKIADQPITVGFLGGRNKVAERTAECLRVLYPGLKVSFAGEEWEDKKDSKIVRYDDTTKKGKKSLNHSISQYPDILFVAFGAPKQEYWMHKHLGKIPVRVMMGVGGAFDEISGVVAVCPDWIDSMGFKWLWRLTHEPWRWRRQLALIEFVWLVLKERLRY